MSSVDSYIDTWAGRKGSPYLDSVEAVSNIAHISASPTICHSGNIYRETLSLHRIELGTCISQKKCLKLTFQYVSE